LAKSALPSAIMRTLPDGLLVAAPGTHHEGVVDRHAPDLVDTPAALRASAFST
jgi:hypothetical protein